jgi:hypothetical protein
MQLGRPGLEAAALMHTLARASVWPHVLDAVWVQCSGLRLLSPRARRTHAPHHTMPRQV